MLHSKSYKKDQIIKVEVFFPDVVPKGSHRNVDVSLTRLSDSVSGSLSPLSWRNRRHNPVEMIFTSDCVKTRY